ncbi:hypothetical protein JCM16303_004015 [Sporobolomyces ruberrimus]
MSITLEEAHETLSIDRGSSIEEVKSAYKKLCIKHHPNGNSPESNVKFKEIGAAYQRILSHHERGSEPRIPLAFSFGGGMPFFFGFPPGEFNCPCGNHGEDEDEEEGDGDWLDELYQAQARETLFNLFGNAMGRGSPAPRSASSAEKKSEKARSRFTELDKDEEAGSPSETDSDSSTRRAEEEKKKEEEREKEAKEKAEKEAAKDREVQELLARRQEEKATALKEKKAAAITSKLAAEVQAAKLARERLALQQKRRSEVFSAARRGDADAVKHGIYVLDVDPNAGEWLPGAKEAVQEGETDKTEVKEESKKSKKRGGKGRNRKKAPSKDDSETIPASTTSHSPEATPSKPTLREAEAKAADTSSPVAEKKSSARGKRNKNKKNTLQGNVDVQTKVHKPTPAPNTTAESHSSPSPSSASTTKSTSASTEGTEPDPRECLLHIAIKLKQTDLALWLIDHGALPEARNSSGFTAFHLALVLNLTSFASHTLSDSPPTYPRSIKDLTSSPDVYYPLPKSQNLILLALNGNSKDPENCLEVVKLVLPFVGGKEVGKAWKKVEWEQVKKRRIKKAMEKWGVWEEVKWLMAERMQELDFEEFSPPEEYRGRRPRRF